MSWWTILLIYKKRMQLEEAGRRATGRPAGQYLPGSECSCRYTRKNKPYCPEAWRITLILEKVHNP